MAVNSALVNMSAMMRMENFVSALTVDMQYAMTANVTRAHFHQVVVAVMAVESLAQRMCGNLEYVLVDPAKAK